MPRGGAVIARYFDFVERRATLGGEVRAGLTTFVVMAYIIFVNPVYFAAPVVARLLRF